MKNYFVAKRVFSILFFIIVILSLIIIPTNAVHAQTPDPGYSYLNSWGGDGRQLLGVNDVAVGPDGRIYIVNRDFDRVTIYDPDTKFFTEFGNYGAEDGQFFSPFSVEVSEAGIVYVADGWYRRMQMFDADGNHIKTFSEFDMNSYHTPLALALDSQQNLLLLHLFWDPATNINANTIIKFSPQGEKLFEFTIPIGNPDGFSLDYAQDIAVDSQDNIIVANSTYGNPDFPALFRISSDFSVLTWIPIEDSVNDYEINGVALDNQNNLYLTSTGYYSTDQIWPENKSSLLICNPTGTIIKTVGQTGTGMGEFDRPQGIAIDNGGRILVSEYNNNRVQILDSDGQFIEAIGTPEAQHGFFHYPGMVEHYNGEIYVMDTNNSRIEVFNGDGSYLRTYANFSPQNPEEPAINPKMVRLDPNGNLFVIDFAYYTIEIEPGNFSTDQYTRISKVNQAGEVLASRIVEKRQNQPPQAFDVDESGNVFIPIPNSKTIWAYNNNLEPLAGWTNPVLAQSAYRVDVDSQGNILLGQRTYPPINTYSLKRLDKTGQVLSSNGEIDLSFMFNGYLVLPVGFAFDVQAITTPFSQAVHWCASMTQILT